MNSEERKIEVISRKIVEIELRKHAEALAPYITDDYVGIDPSGGIAGTIFIYPDTAFRIYPFPSSTIPR